MLSEFFNAWDMFLSFVQGFLVVLVSVVKLLFTTPLLPFTILGFIGIFAKTKSSR